METMEAHNATRFREGLKKLIIVMEFSVLGGWGWGEGYPPYVKIINISSPKKKKKR